MKNWVYAPGTADAGAANVDAWKANQHAWVGDGPPAPTTFFERMWDRLMERYAGCPSVDRDPVSGPPARSPLEDWGYDDIGGPASADVAPEITERYSALARLYSAARDLETDEALEQELEAERAERAAAELAELTETTAVRESTYVRHIRNRSGEVISEEAWERTRAARAQLDEDSVETAIKLESAGRRAFGSGPQAWIVDPISGKSKPIPNFMKRAIIPSVAAEKRAPMIAALELLCRQTDYRFAKFCTFTSGQRVPLVPKTEGAELRAAIQALHRKLNRLNVQPFMKFYGLRLLFRSTEVGSFVEWFLAESGRTVDILEPATPPKNKAVVRERGHGGRTLTVPTSALRSRQHKDENGNWLLHLHAHVLMHWPRYFSAQDRDKIVAQIWQFWGAHWSVDGALEKVREACKYMVKPSDQRLLSEPEFAALDLAFFKTRRVSPLGDLRQQIRFRREHCFTVKRERRIRRDGAERVADLVPVVVPDWNARAKDRLVSKAEKEARKDRKKRRRRSKIAETADRFRVPAEETEDGQKLLSYRRPQMSRAEAEKIATAIVDGDACEFPRRLRTPAKRLGPPLAWQNRVVARLSPAPYFDRVATPALLVWSVSTPDVDMIRAHPVVRQILDATAEQVLTARSSLGRPPAQRSVHTSPVTGRVCTPDPGGTPHFPALLRPSAWEKQSTATEINA
jgi:hypothetical protein